MSDESKGLKKQIADAINLELGKKEWSELSVTQLADRRRIMNEVFLLLFSSSSFCPFFLTINPHFLPILTDLLGVPDGC